jgi:hypothetical protein
LHIGDWGLTEIFLICRPLVSKHGKWRLDVGKLGSPDGGETAAYPASARLTRLLSLLSIRTSADGS